MNGPSFELQAAIVAILTADAGLKSLLGDPVRFYDLVPANAALPYGNWQSDQILDDGDDCSDGKEIFLTLDAWATNDDTLGGRPRVKQILAGYEAALLGAWRAGTFVLPNHHLLEFGLGSPGASVMRDRDGLTAHGVITFRALTEPR